MNYPFEKLLKVLKAIANKPTKEEGQSYVYQYGRGFVKIEEEVINDLD